jgi:hypothetical protein
VGFLALIAFVLWALVVSVLVYMRFEDGPEPAPAHPL